MFIPDLIFHPLATKSEWREPAGQGVGASFCADFFVTRQKSQASGGTQPAGSGSE